MPSSHERFSRKNSAIPARAFSSSSRGRPAGRRGFTLVEVMTASTIFWFVILGVYLMLVRSYQIAALSRCRDEARAVIRTYADQFERLQTTTKVASGASYTRWLFLPDGETGRGLSWGSLSDANVFDTPLSPAPNLAITLGQGAHPVAATISRNVIYVNASTGADSSSQIIQASGYMLKGVFTVKFVLNNKSYSESLTVLRAVP